jgi:hypothetical protein
MNQSRVLADLFDLEYMGINSSGKNIKTRKSFDQIQDDFRIFYPNELFKVLISKREASDKFYKLFNNSIIIFNDKYKQGNLNDTQKKEMKRIFDKYLCMMAYLSSNHRMGIYAQELGGILISLSKLPRNIGRGVIFRVLEYLSDKSPGTFNELKNIIFQLIGSHRIKIPNIEKNKLIQKELLQKNTKINYNSYVKNNNMKNNQSIKSEKNLQNNPTKQVTQKNTIVTQKNTNVTQKNTSVTQKKTIVTESIPKNGYDPITAPCSREAFKYRQKHPIRCNPYRFIRPKECTCESNRK